VNVENVFSTISLCRVVQSQSMGHGKRILKKLNHVVKKLRISTIKIKKNTEKLQKL
jgi:hypothetical protein